MRSAVGATWIMGLVITFIFLFAAFLILALNYSATFKMNNEVIAIIENYEGFSIDTQEIISEYLKGVKYTTRGNCPIGYMGVTDLDRNTLKETTESSDFKSYYCVSKEDDVYDLILFYRFNLPVIGDIMIFPIKGDTRQLEVTFDSNRF